MTPGQRERLAPLATLERLAPPGQPVRMVLLEGLQAPPGPRVQLAMTGRPGLLEHPVMTGRPGQPVRQGLQDARAQQGQQVPPATLAQQVRLARSGR